MWKSITWQASNLAQIDITVCQHVQRDMSALQYHKDVKITKEEECELKWLLGKLGTSVNISPPILYFSQKRNEGEHQHFNTCSISDQNQSI